MGGEKRGEGRAARAARVEVSRTCRSPPCHSTPTPPFWIFARSLLRPSAPSTWRMVLHASMGIRKMRKLAAAADEATDFTAVGRFFVCAAGEGSVTGRGVW